MFSLVLSKSFNSYLRFTIKINELISWVRFLYWVVLPYYVYTTTNITVCKIPSRVLLFCLWRQHYCSAVELCVTV